MTVTHQIFTLSAAFGAPVIQIANPEQFTCTQDAVTIDAGNSEFGAGYTATWFNAQGDTVLTDALQLTINLPCFPPFTDSYSAFFIFYITLFFLH